MAGRITKDPPNKPYSDPYGQGNVASNGEPAPSRPALGEDRHRGLRVTIDILGRASSFVADEVVRVDVASRRQRAVALAGLRTYATETPKSAGAVKG